MVKQHPGGCGLLAALPMDDIEGTLSEIAFAFDKLHADGLIIVTNYGGNYLGNPHFEPVFAELNKGPRRFLSIQSIPQATIAPHAAALDQLDRAPPGASEEAVR